MIIALALAVLLPIAAHSLLSSAAYSPAHVWAYAWAFAWACQGLLGGGFFISRGIEVFVGCCNVSFILGGFIASRSAPVAGIAPRSTGSGRLASRCAWIFLLASCWELNKGLHEMGRPGLARLFSGGFVAFANALRESKASLVVGGQWSVPGAISAAAMFLVAAAVLTGLELGRHEASRKPAAMLTLATLGVAFLLSAGTGVRSHLLVTLLMLVGTYFASRICHVGEGFRISRGTYFYGIAAAVGFLIWVVVVQSARRQDLSFARVADTLHYLRAWFAGYLPALTVWARDGLVGNPELGVNLLRGVFGPLHLAQGAGFSEQIPPVAIGDGSTSNAMTIFRPLLLDFGFVGTLLFCIIAGAVCHRIFMHARSGRRGYILPLACVYAACVFSFNYWFFAYGSRVMGVCFAGAVILLAGFLQRSPRRVATGKPDPALASRRT